MEQGAIAQRMNLVIRQGIAVSVEVDPEAAEEVGIAWELVEIAAWEVKFGHQLIHLRVVAQPKSATLCCCRHNQSVEPHSDRHLHTLKQSS